MDRREILKTMASTLFVHDFAINNIDSSNNNDDKFHFKVQILRADVVNSNKRIYTRKALESALKEGITELGQLGFPESSVTYFAEVSHKVSNPKIDSDGYLTVDIDVLDNTPKGQLLKQMIREDKNSIAFRTSGLSESYRTENEITIIDDFYITNVSAVPSYLAANIG